MTRGGLRTGPRREPARALQPRLLFLPPAGGPYAEDGRDRFAARPADLDGLPGYQVFGARPVEARRLFWYRWIAGHQISFSLWRVISDIVLRHGDDAPSEREIDTLVACVDGYSAMLLYSSTVPREHYHAHLRPRMALQHPAFSGAWAPDYRPVRLLLRGRFGWQADRSGSALADAVDRNHRTHDHIADHLVPDGKSLLQKTAGVTKAGVTPDKEDLYDNFFLTIRRPVSHAEFLAQLRERVVELASDLAENGLFPEVDGRHHPVVTSRSDPVMRPLITDVVTAVARATRLAADVREEVRA
ncbi:L-tyrosine 3-hydroxylase [Saccharothrix sp. S26]|uniref:L-tyrosine 3-hydroxylase n=1 Tax=Saccharothrix sp. S26 TaxID=2907215 RepID=UPI001F32B643|nr:L-tyrosine 3-hydroxylase [Saccharothrix sp. S26]MCE7000413.1 L-tyrosine 3-hydroxylase [Saccharothrix sp. S26]